MIIKEKENFIRLKAKEHLDGSSEKILWSLHAVRKIRIESLKKKDVENSLKESTTIENYSMEGRTLPGCLALTFVNSCPIHLVVAIDVDFDRLFIVTVYKPSLERWKNDWKTRKK